MSNRDSETPEADGDAAEPTKDLIFPAEIFEGIPEDEREAFSRKLIAFGLQITREEHYSSEPPSHEEAAGWNAPVPGTAERIFHRYEELEIKRLEASDRVLDIAEANLRTDHELQRKQHEDFVDLTKAEQCGRG